MNVKGQGIIFSKENVIKNHIFIWKYLIILFRGVGVSPVLIRQVSFSLCLPKIFTFYEFGPLTIEAFLFFKIFFTLD